MNLTPLLLLLFIEISGVFSGFARNTIDLVETLGDEFMGNYKYNECDGLDTKIHLNQLEATPKQFIVGESINMSIGFNITKDVEPTEVHLNIYKYLPFMGYVKLPCILNYGSCTYNKICTKMNTYPKDSFDYRVLCPSWFKATGIECKCPLKKGYYKSTDIKVPIQDSIVPRWIATGDYKIALVMKDNGKILACNNFQFRLK